MNEKGFANVDSLDVARQDSVDAANQERLQKIIRHSGWPSKDAVGKSGVEAAFLIVQHGDPQFQEEMLPAVRAAYEQGEVPGQALAPLIDRVLRNQGKPQRYGTQVEMQGEKWALEPIESRKSVDQRRRELGLMPLDEYLQKLEEYTGMEVEVQK